MGRNQYWAGRVYDLCVYYMAGTPEGSTELHILIELHSYTLRYVHLGEWAGPVHEWACPVQEKQLLLCLLTLLVCIL